MENLIKKSMIMVWVLCVMLTTICTITSYFDGSIDSFMAWTVAWLFSISSLMLYVKIYFLETKDKNNDDLIDGL